MSSKFLFLIIYLLILNKFNLLQDEVYVQRVYYIRNNTHIVSILWAKVYICTSQSRGNFGGRKINIEICFHKSWNISFNSFPS